MKPHWIKKPRWYVGKNVAWIDRDGVQREGAVASQTLWIEVAVKEGAKLRVDASKVWVLDDTLNNGGGI